MVSGRGVRVLPFGEQQGGEGSSPVVSTVSFAAPRRWTGHDQLPSYSEMRSRE